MKILTEVLAHGEPVKDVITEQAIEVLRYAVEHGYKRAEQGGELADMLETGELRLLQGPSPNPGTLVWFSEPEWDRVRALGESVVQAGDAAAADTTHASTVLDSLMGMAWEGEDDE